MLDQHRPDSGGGDQDRPGPTSSCVWPATSIPTARSTPPNRASARVRGRGVGARSGRAYREQRADQRHRRDHDRGQRRGDVLLAGGDQRERDRDLGDCVGEQPAPLAAQRGECAGAPRRAPAAAPPPASRGSTRRSRRDAVAHRDLDQQVRDAPDQRHRREGNPGAATQWPSLARRSPTGSIRRAEQPQQLVEVRRRGVIASSGRREACSAQTSSCSSETPASRRRVAPLRSRSRAASVDRLGSERLLEPLRSTPARGPPSARAVSGSMIVFAAPWPTPANRASVWESDVVQPVAGRPDHVAGEQRAERQRVARLVVRLHRMQSPSAISRVAASAASAATGLLSKRGAALRSRGRARCRRSARAARPAARPTAPGR